MKANRIDHVALLVRNMDAAIARLADGFRLDLASDAVVAGGTLRMAYLRAGDTMLQLISPLGPGPFQDALAENGESLHHICFEVDSIPDAMVSRNPDDFTVPALGGMGASVCFLRQPVHGLVVELTEKLPLAPSGVSQIERVATRP